MRFFLLDKYYLVPFLRFDRTEAAILFVVLLVDPLVIALDALEAMPLCVRIEFLAMLFLIKSLSE